MLQQLRIRNNSFLIANILAWVFFLSVNTTFYLILSLKNKAWLLDFDAYLKGVIFNITLLFFFFFHRFRLENLKEKDTSELLQYIFRMAISSFFASITFFLSTLLLRNHTLGNHLMYLDAFYSFSILLLINLLSYSLFIFRTLIFRQASKK
ncbi:MAG: hypothetical protein SFU27_01210, partial [Thermonemataceae bacterium]|nr:hypothetical protein [Thermonemataceae bacterium]